MLTYLAAVASLVDACPPASEVQLGVPELDDPTQFSVEWQCPAADCDVLQSVDVHYRRDDVTPPPTSPSTTRYNTRHHTTTP